MSSLLIVCVDVTAQVLARQQIQESEQYFRQLTDTVPAVVWETRPDGYCTYLNQQWYELTGQTPAEAEGYGWLDATHPDDKAESGRVFLEANEAQVPFNIIYRLRQKNGSYRWAIDKGSPRFGLDGTYEGMIGTVLDIHDRKLAEEEVTRFKFMADNASDPFILMRQDGTFAYLNQLALDRWGYTADEARHIRVPDVDPIYQDKVFNAVFAQAQHEEILPFETLHQRKDGHIYPVEVNMGGLTLNGEPHMFAVARDITERKQAEAALRQSQEQQAFLLRLSDQLRLLTDTASIQYQAACTLGEYVGADRVGYAEDQNDGQHVVVTRNYTNGVPGIEGRYQYKDYGAALMSELQAGRMVVRPDIANDPTLTEAEKEAHAMLQLGATVNFPLMKADRMTGILFLHYNGPHDFSDGELNLLKETAERTWEAVSRARAEESLRISEAKLRSLITAAPVAIGLFIGRDLVIDLPNQTFIDIVGKGPDIAGKPLREVMPELITENQPFLQILDDVYTSGKQFQSYGSMVQIVQQGVMTHNYYNITYSPLYNEAGEIYAILDVAVDVTGQIRAQQALQQSEQKLRSLIESAPFPIGVYVGREMRIELANQSILDVWGKGNNVIGKRYAEILPELENQLIFSQLDEVYRTGIPFHAKNQRVDLVVDGQLRPYYFNYSFTPLIDPFGQVYGVMNTAAEVTDLALAKQKVEEAEAALRGAVELAELGTWELDVATGRATYSDRIMDWFGFKDNFNGLDRVFNPIHERDRSRIEAAVGAALEPGSPGIYNEEYTVVNQQTGAERILHTQGKVFFDAKGKPLKLSGTAQDVTQDRQLQQELERLVQERTRQLQESIHDLERSNHNLQQFAYVASHDLQEPLRKIQSFGDLLKTEYGECLAEGQDYLTRMQVSAGRMSVLIKDLLTYSRISTRQETSVPVQLDGVVQSVLQDLEVAIQDAGAQVEVSKLPTILGDKTQLRQLFQNLIGNALKFRQANGRPHIRITTQLLTALELPAQIRPARQAEAYYRVDIQDNGIGFDQKYTDRIFQVFQRLHGKNEYVGTGIGLAICEKVATNHGGPSVPRANPAKEPRLVYICQNSSLPHASIRLRFRHSGRL